MFYKPTWWKEAVGYQIYESFKDSITMYWRFK